MIRVRIDSEFSGVDTLDWFTPLTPAMDKGTVFASFDFAWAAGRAEAGRRLAYSGARISQYQSAGQPVIPLGYPMIDKSEWAHKCSIFCDTLGCKDVYGSQAEGNVKGSMERKHGNMCATKIPTPLHTAPLQLG